MKFQDRGFFRDIWKDVLERVIAKKRVLSQAGIMAGARVVGLGLGVVGNVWAARCLGPHNLGLSGMVQNFVSQAMLFMGVIYPTVLVREYKNSVTRHQQERLVKVTNSFRLLFSLLVCVGASIYLGLQGPQGDYGRVGWFFLPLLLVNALQPTWVFQAEEKQHFQSVIAVFQSALKAGAYLFFLKAGASAGADLTVITLVGGILAFIYWLFLFKSAGFKGSLFDFKDLGLAWDLVLRSRWLFFSGLCSYVYSTLEQPLLGWLSSLEELGRYRTAVTVVGAADSFFTIIPMVLYPRFIEWRKKGGDLLEKRQIKLVFLFSLLGSVGSISAFVIGPWIYPMVFGQAFAKAAIPCALLITSKIIVIVTGIFYWGLMTDDRHDRLLSMTTFGMAIFSLASNLILIPKYGMLAAASVNLSSEAILLFVCLWAFINQNRSLRKAS